MDGKHRHEFAWRYGLKLQRFEWHEPSRFSKCFLYGPARGDPPGKMTLGEGSIFNGTGSQTGGNRWGDYTSIDIDPVDDTTFWVINE